MELRYQTQSFFVMLACLFFLAGCGSYQVEETLIPQHYYKIFFLST